MTDAAKITALFLGEYPETVMLIEGAYVCRGDALGSFVPIVLLAFQELIDAGFVVQVEKWPFPGYARNTDKDLAIMDIWKEYGFKADYVMPGIIAPV